MKLIDDVEVCKELVNKRKGCFSNCFFLLGQMEALVERQKLYYYENKGGNFWLLYQELSFYRGYYFIKNPKKLCKLKLNKPVVIEFPFRNHLTVAQIGHIEMIKKIGFCLERESRRMSLKAEKAGLGNIIFCHSNLKITYAFTEDILAIHNLFKEKFNELFAFLLSKEELNENIKKKWVMAVYQEGQVVGALNFTVKGNIAEVEQIAIKEMGVGIGSLLLEKWHELYKNKVKIFRLWVDSANSRAISMYKKAGYEFDGSCANEYVYHPDNK